MAKAIDLGNYRELEKIMKNVSGEFSRISETIERTLKSPVGKLGAIVAGAGYMVGSGLKMTGSFMQYAGQERQVAIDYALNRASSVFQEQQARMQMLYSGNVAGIRDLMQYGPQARTIAERRFGAQEEQLKGRMLQTAGGISDVSLGGAMRGGGLKMGAAGAGVGLAFEGVGALPGAIAGFVVGTATDMMKQIQQSAQQTGLAKQQLDEFRKSKDIFITTQMRELSTALAQMADPFARAMEDVIQPRVNQDFATIRNLGMSAGQYYRGRQGAQEAGLAPEQYTNLRQNLMGQGFTSSSQGAVTDLATQAMNRNALAGSYEERAAYISSARMYGGASSGRMMSGQGLVQNRYSDPATQLSMQQAEIQQMSSAATFTREAQPFSAGIVDAMRTGAVGAGVTEDQANAISRRLAGNTPGLTQAGGTIENQVLRAGIRGALNKAGLRGPKLVYAEQYFQGKSLQRSSRCSLTSAR